MEPKQPNNKKVQLDPITIASIIGMVGIIIAAIIILVVFFKPTKEEKPYETASLDAYAVSEGALSTSESALDEGEVLRMLAVVTNIDTDNKKIYLLDVDSEEDYSAKVDGTVDIRDEYGQAITLKTLKMGDMVEVKMDSNAEVPESIKISGKTWEKEEATNVAINQDKHTVEVDNQIYNYTDEIIVLEEGLEMDIADLDPVDEVTLRGYRDKVWVIERTNGHGSVSLQNQDLFVGGTLRIGTEIQADVTDSLEIKVPVGKYDLTLSKEGMQDYTTTISVTEGVKTLVDVQSAKAAEGIVNFVVTPDGASVVVNNEVKKDYASGVTLAYGTYDVVIKKDGYIDYTGKVTVDSEKMDFKVDLKQAPQYINVDTPEGAEIYIDANFLGTVPIHSPIDPGTHNIILRQDGYKSKAYTITVEDNGKDATFAFPDLEVMESDSTTTTQ